MPALIIFIGSLRKIIKLHLQVCAFCHELTISTSFRWKKQQIVQVSSFRWVKYDEKSQRLSRLAPSTLDPLARIEFARDRKEQLGGGWKDGL